MGGLLLLLGERGRGRGREPEEGVAGGVGG